MVLFSGDGDFRSLVEALQRKGVRVTVVSTISTQPPMVADELRRQADIFLDIVELQSKIGRDPSERAAARSRATTAEPRRAQPHAAVPAAPRRAAARRRRATTISTTIDRAGADAGAAPSRRPRLSALPAARRVPRQTGARASRTGSTRRSRPSARSTRGC